MAQIESLFISASTKEAFQTRLDAGDIMDYTIVFIEDTKEIYAKGVYYPCSVSKEELEDMFINISSKGQPNGVASLDDTGKIPSSQLPSYVDDVVEYATQSQFPQTGESGLIYIDQSTNQTYRWGGSSYIEIGKSLALGETASTAYAGNKGKQNADNISTLQSKVTQIDSYTINSKNISTNPVIDKSDIGLSNVDNTSDLSKPISTATQTALDGKQATLVSGTNIKTVNGQSLLGSGNISITEGGGVADSVAWSNVTDKPDWIGATKPTYSYTEIQNTPDNATTSEDGLMSKEDKTKLDGLNNYTLPKASTTSLGGIKVGDGLEVESDGTLNCIIDPGSGTVSWGNIQGKPSFATVATTGSYNDLSDKPTIPEEYSLPPASSTTLGGVKVGAGLSITGDGTLSSTGGGVADSVEWDNIVGTPEWIGNTKPVYNYSEIEGTPGNATTVTSGLMSSSDKTKLDQLDTTTTWNDVTEKPSELVTSVDISGTGNAVTNATFSGSTLTIQKGNISTSIEDGSITESKLADNFQLKHTITFTGAANGSFNGSQDLTINIPTSSGSGGDGNTTYSFANGTDGSFTVTPSNSSAQKVTIGKPSTAGTADNVNWTGILNAPIILNESNGVHVGTASVLHGTSSGSTLTVTNSDDFIGQLIQNGQLDKLIQQGDEIYPTGNRGNTREVISVNGSTITVNGSLGTASSYRWISMGKSSTASLYNETSNSSGDGAVALGIGNSAGERSVALGSLNIASHKNAVAIGTGAVTSKDYQIVLGPSPFSDNTINVAIGYQQTITKDNAIAIDSDGKVYLKGLGGYDGTTINSTDNSVQDLLSSGGSGYVLPVASEDTLGGVKIGNGIDISEDGTISISGGGSGYVLPIASEEVLGGVKKGTNVSIDTDGTISVTDYSIQQAAKKDTKLVGYSFVQYDNNSHILSLTSSDSNRQPRSAIILCHDSYDTISFNGDSSRYSYTFVFGADTLRTGGTVTVYAGGKQYSVTYNRSSRSFDLTNAGIYDSATVLTSYEQ